MALILLYPFIYLLLICGERFYPAVHNIRKYGCRFVLLITGIRYEIYGNLNVAAGKPCIICTNHSSALDIIVPLAAFDFYHHYMGKHELADIPFFGIFFKYMDIPVYRTGNTGLYKSYARAEADLRKNIPLVIFPEGTTSSISPEMLRFKNGAFKLAVENNVPVIPVVFLDHWHMNHYHEWQGKPGKSRIVVGDKIYPKEGPAEVNRIKEETYKKMKLVLEKEYENIPGRREERNS